MHGFRDEGGLFGVAGSRRAAHYAYLGLHALQRRGLHGAGLVTFDGHLLRSHHGLGLIHDVFTGPDLRALDGHLAVGQVHHDPAGDPRSGSRAVDRPLVARYREGQLAIAMVGELTNRVALSTALRQQGAVFSTRSDAEILVHLMARSMQKTLVNRLVDALWKVEAAFSLVLIAEDHLVAVRDPRGFRPLYLGRLEEAAMVASEVSAFDLLGARTLREVEPGEMIIVDPNGMSAVHPFPHRDVAACAMELIELARSDVMALGRSVYQTRHRLGERLAREQPCAGADVVIGVPDHAIPAALGYAQLSGIPYRQGLVRAPYTGRSFVEPTRELQGLRHRLRLSAVSGALAGQEVVLVASSLVIEDEMAGLVSLILQAGAKGVHLRVASPLVRGACYYGVHTPTREELPLHRHRDLRSLAGALGVSSLAHLSQQGLARVLGGTQWCTGCLSGQYPLLPDERMEVQLSMFEGDE